MHSVQIKYYIQNDVFTINLEIFTLWSKKCHPIIF